MDLIRGIALLGAAVLLTACEKEDVLQGQRLDPRAVVTGAAPEEDALVSGSAPIGLPAPQANADWPQRAGNAQHDLINPVLGAGVTEVWKADIGDGQSRRYRLVAEPVVARGMVFTIDSRATVTATSTSGGRVWQADVTPPGDHASDASGSGLAYDDGKLFVTSGFGELVALDSATGQVLWRKNFGAGIGGAPTVSAGVAYVVTRDAAAYAVRTSDGKILWQFSSAPTKVTIGGGSAPVLTDKLVIFPFANGELQALLKTNGLSVWNGSVAGQRNGRGYTVIEDMTGEPVVAGKVLYAGSSSGRLSAFDVDTGEMLWSAPEGAVSPVQVVGGSVFYVNDNGRLQRLDAKSGKLIWSKDLPYWTDDRVRKQNRIWVHYGPVMAGNRLFLASSDGYLRVFDPVNGNLLSTGKIPGGASTDPVVAGGTLYDVSRDGVLFAYR